MTEDVDVEVRNKINEYADKLRTAGHTVTEVDLPMAEYALAIYYIIVPAELIDMYALLFIALVAFDSIARAIPARKSPVYTVFISISPNVFTASPIIFSPAAMAINAPSDLVISTEF